jgi:hypothetical protein
LNDEINFQKRSKSGFSGSGKRQKNNNINKVKFWKSYYEVDEINFSQIIDVFIDDVLDNVVGFNPKTESSDQKVV